MYIIIISKLFSDVELTRYSQKIASDTSDYLTGILLKIIEKNHDAEDHTFAKACSILCQLRTWKPKIQELILRWLSSVKDVGIPEVITDFYDKVG